MRRLLLAVLFLFLPLSAQAQPATSCCKCYKGPHTTENSFCIPAPTPAAGCVSALATISSSIHDASAAGATLTADTVCDSTVLTGSSCELLTSGSASAQCRILPTDSNTLCSALATLSHGTCPLSGSDSGSGSTVADAGSSETKDTPFSPITPELGVPIPGSTLSPATKEGNSVRVAFLAQYINGAYHYLTAVILVIAIVMCVYGAFLYLLGSGGVGSIQRGKEIIINSIMGMLIALGGYAILNTVNPDTVNLKVLDLAFVQREDLEYISSADYRAATGMSLPSTGEVAAIVHEVAAEQGLDECGLSAVTIGESGGRSDAIGYDSNVPRVGVGSRRAFIKSGRKFSGATFTPPPGPWGGTDDCHIPISSITPAQRTAIEDRTIRNDAHFNPTARDFGIDDRFSIGIGAGQVTLLVGTDCRLPRCPDGQLGRTVDGTCYTVPQLLEPRPQLIAASSIYRRAYEGCNSYPDPYIRQRCTFAHYGGTGCSVRVGACIKMKLWAACHGQEDREVENCRAYWLSQTEDYCNNYNNG